MSLQEILVNRACVLALLSTRTTIRTHWLIRQFTLNWPRLSKFCVPNSMFYYLILTRNLSFFFSLSHQAKIKFSAHLAKCRLPRFRPKNARVPGENTLLRTPRFSRPLRIVTALYIPKEFQSPNITYILTCRNNEFDNSLTGCTEDERMSDDDISMSKCVVIKYVYYGCAEIVYWWMQLKIWLREKGDESNSLIEEKKNQVLSKKERSKIGMNGEGLACLEGHFPFGTALLMMMIWLLVETTVHYVSNAVL